MDDRSRTHVTKDLTHSGPFPLSAVTSARLPRVTTPPGSSTDRGKTSCPQQLAQPRTTQDHQQGNGGGRQWSESSSMATISVPPTCYYKPDKTGAEAVKYLQGESAYVKI